MTKTAFLPLLPPPDPPLVPGDEPAATPPAELARILLPSQGEIGAYLSVGGNLVITEDNWPEDPIKIIIGAELIGVFIDRLTDLLGYGGARP